VIRAILFWSTAISLIAIAGTGGWYVAELKRELQDLHTTIDISTRRAHRAEVEMEAMREIAAEREALIAIINNPDVQQLSLVGQRLAPRASARALWSDSTNMAFMATGLPPLPAGDAYQLWFFLQDAPLTAGLIEPDPNGSTTVMIEVPDAVTLPVAMAVTIEPTEGMSTPTGDYYLLGKPPTM